MGLATTKVAVTVGKTAYKHRKKIVIFILSFFLLLIMMVASIFMAKPEQGGTADVSEAVLQWRPVVEEFAHQYGIPDYVDVILAIMMIESGGKAADIMQSSESLGLPPNTISDPVTSIDVGVKHLSGVIKDAKSKKMDFWTPIQSYNFGSGFNDFVSSNGKKYSFELAAEFASIHANGRKVKYSNSVADFNDNWRYQYGNMYYVMLVQQYIDNSTDVGNADASPLGSDYKNLMREVIKYKGWGYVWGGSNPNVGFDCSGLTQYNYRLIGYNLPRTAAEQHKATIPVSDPKPGDLIFFKGTNPSRPASSITHVGIYVDENKMYNSNNSGTGYSTWSSGYWKKHFAGFGRVKK